MKNSTFSTELAFVLNACGSHAKYREGSIVFDFAVISKPYTCTYGLSQLQGMTTSQPHTEQCCHHFVTRFCAGPAILVQCFIICLIVKAMIIYDNSETILGSSLAI